jgi:Ca2+ transporting ATPase
MQKSKKSNKNVQFLQLRVIRAFKSTLEDLEDRRSIHSIRSFRNMHVGHTPVTSSLLYSNKSFLKNFNRDQSPPGNITIQVPTSPININDMNARYIDDDGPDDTRNNEKTRETRI